ncbi:MAG TPA: Crp/Fnr family transcriptional regulator [Thiotrichaceae bacterium]|nr:Crp/Fnr family transcriptional regulator [Thiotrichaceae bacterium]HIM08171.1 Crp/Fnr family transcriptional regulator [Gammaproteobacteria bacterium]
MDENVQKKPRPRLIGEYLPCSRGSIRIAMQKKRDTKLIGQAQKRIGEILIDLDIVEQEEMVNALRQQRADRLGLCSVFESLNRAELAAIGNQFSETSLKADQQFIFEGENDPTLYILAAGKLEVFTKDDNGDEIHIAYVDPIEPIGEMGYFQGGIRTASVRTVTPTELLSASYKYLTHYFEHVPHVAHAFLDVINRRQAETQERLKKTNN